MKEIIKWCLRILLVTPVVAGLYGLMLLVCWATTILAQVFHLYGY